MSKTAEKELKTRLDMAADKAADRGPPNYAIVAATTCVRLGREDELLQVGTYGLRASQIGADALIDHLTKLLGKEARPVAVPYADYRAFPAEDLWREANELPPRAAPED